MAIGKTDSDTHITVKKATLLKTLRDNQKKHKEEYAAAVKGFKKKQIELLKAAYETAAKGGTPDIRSVYSLAAPADHTDDYQEVIEMLEMSVKTTFTITRDQFRKYCRDMWDWSANFNQTKAFYAGG